jgi:excinuclease ABC subunit A
VDQGNTVVVIEHNLDVIRSADHLIDLGPEGGAGGGRLIATGSPQHVAGQPQSATGEFLRELLPPGVGATRTGVRKRETVSKDPS